MTRGKHPSNTAEKKHRAIRRPPEVWELITDGFVALDRSARITYFNAVSESTSGTSRADALGNVLWEVCPQLKGTAVEKAIARAATSRHSAELEHFHGATKRWFFVRAHPTNNDGVWVFFHDITERKQLEIELQTIHQRTFEILESTKDSFFALDEDWRFTYVNGRAEQALGRRREDLLGKVIWDEFPEMVGTPMFGKLRASAKEQRRLHFEADFAKAGLIEADVHPCASGVCVYFRPASVFTTRNIAPDEIVWAEERERRRIARDLHDGASQLLTALTVGLANLAEVKDLREAQVGARRLRMIASRALREISRFTHGPEDFDLQEGGLLKAVHAMVADWKAAYQITVTVALERINSLDLPISTQISLYRIMQEALSNVARHSGATRVRIQSRLQAGKLQLVIRDNGRGFSATVRNDRGAHLGLRSMRERAEMLGGELEVNSIRGRGTSLAVTIPLRATLRKAG